MTRRSLLLLALALAAATLQACGGEESAARARDGRVAVTIKDFRYEPQLIRASPDRLRLDFVNRGRLAHTFRLERGTLIGKVSSLLPGDRATKTVRVRKGEYRFFCALSNHEELGLYGTLVVR